MVVVLLLLVGLLGIGTIVVLVLPATRPASSAEAAAVVVAATIAGMGALGLSNTTDDAAGGAAWLAVGATCVVTAFGPLARRKDPDARLPLPGRRSHDGVAEEASSTPRPPATS